MRYFLELSYNGKAYHGWQIQPNAITVQAVIEKALSTLLKQPTAIVGAGRTDTGVHAKQLFAHFNFEGEIEVQNLVYKLNSFLPKDIAITTIFKVKPEAHARFDALSRTYHYHISTAKNVFNNDFSYQVLQPLNVEKMNEASAILLQYQDFECFSKSNTDVKTYLCNITEAFWTPTNTNLQFTITANRFLRNMVRAIVGTLVNVGLGKLSVDDVHTIIASKSRSEAGFSVPAQGLFLVNVEYPEEIRLE